MLVLAKALSVLLAFPTTPAMPTTTLSSCSLPRVTPSRRYFTRAHTSRALPCYTPATCHGCAFCLPDLHTLCHTTTAPAACLLPTSLATRHQPALLSPTTAFYQPTTHGWLLYCVHLLATFGFSYMTTYCGTHRPTLNYLSLLTPLPSLVPTLLLFKQISYNTCTNAGDDNLPTGCRI